MTHLKRTKSVYLSFIMIFILGLYTSSSCQQNISEKGYGKATYNKLTDNEFMKNWLILGPVKLSSSAESPDDKKQKEYFEKDAVTSVKVNPKKSLNSLQIGDSTFSWTAHASSTDEIWLSNIYTNNDYCYAYALAEINSDKAKDVVFGVGSDDAIKIFLNGELVHKKWIARGIRQDEDFVTLNLKKGSNQLLIKVQDMQGDWGFCIRKLGNDILANQLIEAAGIDDSEKIKFLLDKGIDINHIGDYGLTAYQFAQIKGREKIMELLKEKGAKTDIPLPPFAKLVDKVFRNANNTTSGASVLISQEGKIIYQNAYGCADIGNKVKVSPNTKFRIGSVTKQFVATAILKLQEDGKLSVNDKLSKYLPDFPKADSVTIHHLLTHTSGIHSYTNRPDFIKYTTMPITPDALVDTIKAYPYDFNPGESFLYNNSGFFLLGYIIEKITEKSWGEYLKEVIFDPIGMKSTGVYKTNILLENEAYGYAYDGKNILKSLNWDMEWAGGAGAMYSTTEDLHKWNEAIFNYKVISKESLEKAHSPVILNNGQKIDYGYGWALGKYRGANTVGHGGGLHGFLSYLVRETDSKTNIVVLCNSTPPPPGINPSANSILIGEYLLWEKLDKQSSLPDIKVDDKTLKSYEGKYDYGNNLVLTVELEEGQLYAQMTGQPRFPIFPVSNTKFKWKVVEASIDFAINEKGEVTHVTHSQGGNSFDAKRIIE